MTMYTIFCICLLIGLLLGMNSKIKNEIMSISILIKATGLLSPTSGIQNDWTVFIIYYCI